MEHHLHLKSHPPQYLIVFAVLQVKGLGIDARILDNETLGFRVQEENHHLYHHTHSQYLHKCRFGVKDRVLIPVLEDNYFTLGSTSPHKNSQ